MDVGILYMSELQRLKLLFESNRILIHVGNENTARNYGMYHPSGSYALFTVFDGQYQDAKLLLNDERHLVKKPVDLKKLKL